MRLPASLVHDHRGPGVVAAAAWHAVQGRVRWWSPWCRQSKKVVEAGLLRRILVGVDRVHLAHGDAFPAIH